MTWLYHKDLNGKCGFGDGFIDTREGLIVTPENELTADQKRRLDESPLWSRVEQPSTSKPKQSAKRSKDLGADPSLPLLNAVEEPEALPVEEKPKPKRKRSTRKKSTAKKSEA